MDQSPASRAETLEQADLIAQLVKYSDRLLVIQADEPDSRREFVKLVVERLPQDVHIFSLEASTDATPQQLISDLVAKLQLSPGIESPRQLVTAIHEAFAGNTRALVIIDAAEQWYDQEQWTDLLELVRVAHDMASRHLLFMLAGDAELEERLRASVTLSDMQGDIHTAVLPTATDTVTETVPEADLETKEEATDELIAEPSSQSIPPRPIRQRRFNPTLLVVAAISVLIVTVGGFALLSRSSKDVKPASETIAVKPETKIATVDKTSNAATQPTQLASNQPAQPMQPPTAEVQQPASTTQAMPKTTEPPQSAQRQVQPPAASQGADTAPVTSAQPNKPVETAAHSTQSAASPQATPEKPTAAESRPVKKPEPIHKPTEHKAAEHEAASAKHKVEKQAHAKLPDASDNRWYQHRPRARAVVQLGAFNDLKSARAFIKAHAQGSLRTDQWHIFTQKPKGRLLYTVTLGDYASLERARYAVKALPRNLQKLRPYPRSIGSVQDAIKG